MRNQKGKKIGLHMLTAALFFVLAMSVCTVKTEAKDYKQGKVYTVSYTHLTLPTIWHV